MHINKNVEPIFRMLFIVTLNYIKVIKKFSCIKDIALIYRLIFGLLPFSVYSLSPGELIQSHHFKCHVLTFDSQIFISTQISPQHTRSVCSTACSVLSLGCFIGISDLPCLKKWISSSVPALPLFSLFTTLQQDSFF